DEVERVADRVALLDNGRILFSGPLDEVRGRHHRLTLRFSEPRATPPALDGVLSWGGGGQEWTAVVEGARGQVQSRASATGGTIIEESSVGLTDVLVAHAGGKRS